MARWSSVTLACALIVCYGVVTVSSVILASEVCRVRPTVVSVDPVNHTYLPYFVTVNRCGGSVGAVKPSLKTCVAATVQFINVSVMDTADPQFSQKSVQLVNHTSCMAGCVKSEQNCDLRYQSFDSHMCGCKCMYTGPPTTNPCVFPLAWSQTSCSCQCPSTPRACPSIKEWRTELCGCACKTAYSLKCAREGSVLNSESCECVPPPTIITGTSSGRTGSGSTVSIKIVIVIVIVEFMVILGTIFLLYVFCSMRNNNNSSTWTKVSRPRRWFVKRQNEYHVDPEPPFDGGTTPDDDIDQLQDYPLEEVYSKSDQASSSETEIFYESKVWNTDADTDQLSRDSMQESEDARITRV